MRRFALPSRSTRRQDAWQVIYMDLMTIIMVFFVILWSINQRQDIGLSDTVGEETVKLVNLPGDVLFASGRSDITHEGRQVFDKLFHDPTGNVLNFDTGGLVKRLLVIHGHTDSTGRKDDNLELGYKRALAAYRSIARHSEELSQHVVICTHADNSPAQEVPVFQGQTTSVERAAIRDAQSANRRITIEDKVVNQFGEADP
jgi:outer membrane protein OmpA-like peptidoglycan-associated protein